MSLAKQKQRDHSAPNGCERPEPVALMSALLRTMGTDLGNEREMVRVLIGAKFTSAQVKNLMDHVTEIARGKPVS